MTGRSEDAAPPAHPEDAIVALVEGRLGGRSLSDVVGHLRGCAHCKSELVEIVTAVGALRMAADASRSDLAGAELSDPTGPVATPADRPLTAGRRDSGVRTARLSPPLRWLSAAAALLAIALAAAGLVMAGGGHHGPAGRSIALAPLSDLSARGAVQMASGGADSTMIVQATLPEPPSNTYYEVWLLREETGGMVPIGVLPSTGTGRFSIPDIILAGYDAVDVSLQPNNGSTTHSTTSVLRARYASSA